MTSYVAKKYLASHAKAYEPPDPYYEHIIDAKGRQKRVKRDVPPGLSKRDEKTLRKVRKRAHYLDKGMNLCGFKVGWTFWIGIIPGAGDVVNIVLNYTLVVKPSRKLDIPGSLVSEMMFNNAVAAGVGFVPLVGDVVMAAWKTNWRNANALEAYLRKRGAENLQAGGTSALTEVPVANEAVSPVSPAAARATPVTAGAPVAAGAPPAPVARKTKKNKKKGWFSRSKVEDEEEDEEEEALQAAMTQSVQPGTAGLRA